MLRLKIREREGGKSDRNNCACRRCRPTWPHPSTKALASIKIYRRQRPTSPGSCGVAFDPGCDGGGGGIRTHGTLSRTTVFKTVAIDHSATPPHGVISALCYSGVSWSRGIGDQLTARSRICLANKGLPTNLLLTDSRDKMMKNSHFKLLVAVLTIAFVSTTFDSALSDKRSKLTDAQKKELRKRGKDWCLKNKIKGTATFSRVEIMSDGRVRCWWRG